MGDAPGRNLLTRLLPTLAAPSREATGAIDRVLRAVRDHLALDVAFIAEFKESERVFRHVDAAGWSPINAGEALSLDVGYCKHVVEGRLPRLITDTACVPLAAGMPETQSIPIGSHLSVPVYLPDGRFYGTFCCFGFQPDPTLNERDLNVLSAFADLVAYQIALDLDNHRQHDAMLDRLQTTIARGGPTIVFQPIFRLADDRYVGVECLSRFPAASELSPQSWFEDAEKVGLALELEVCAIANALRALTHLPENLFLALNASPRTVMAPGFETLFVGLDTRRIVLELTEHAIVEDYAPLQRRLTWLRGQGVRISVDDAGAGYASMRHILCLEPDIIKLDISLTRNIHQDRARRAMAAALVEFGRQTGSDVLAEGVESAEELALLRELGVDTAQGFFLSPPVPLAEALQRMGH